MRPVLLFMCARFEFVFEMVVCASFVFSCNAVHAFVCVHVVVDALPVSMF